MIKDDIIFCQYRDGQNREYDTQVVKKVVDDIAITEGGCRIDAVTGVEQNKKFGTRTWEVLSVSNREDYKKIVEYKKAKKWVSRINEFPELLVAAYRTCTQGKEADQRLFFHELDTDPYKLLYSEKMGTILAQYRKPYWCGHPFAMSGWFGCPRLLKGKKVSERLCQECSCYANPRFGDYFKRLRLIAGISTDQVGRYLQIKDYKSLEEGQRRAKPAEIEQLMNLFCVEDWYFVDILKMLYTPKQDRDFELDDIYRNTIQNKLKQK